MVTLIKMIEIVLGKQFFMGIILSFWTSTKYDKANSIGSCVDNAVLNPNRDLISFWKKLYFIEIV